MKVQGTYGNSLRTSVPESPRKPSSSGPRGSAPPYYRRCPRCSCASSSGSQWVAIRWARGRNSTQELSGGERQCSHVGATTLGAPIPSARHLSRRSPHPGGRTSPAMPHVAEPTVIARQRTVLLRRRPNPPVPAGGRRRSVDFCRSRCSRSRSPSRRNWPRCSLSPMPARRR